jgi:hypothetical protein
MYLVAIAWMYVVVMMSVVEAFSSNGTVLGAAITFVLYGLLPLSIVMYVLRAPARRTARKAVEAQELEQAQTAQAAAATQPASASGPDASGPNTSGHTARDGAAPVGKEA